MHDLAGFHGGASRLGNLCICKVKVDCHWQISMKPACTLFSCDVNQMLSASRGVLQNLPIPPQFFIDTRL